MPCPGTWSAGKSFHASTSVGAERPEAPFAVGDRTGESRGVSSALWDRSAAGAAILDLRRFAVRTVDDEHWFGELHTRVTPELVRGFPRVSRCHRRSIPDSTARIAQPKRIVGASDRRGAPATGATG